MRAACLTCCALIRLDVFQHAADAGAQAGEQHDVIAVVAATVSFITDLHDHCDA